jgi:hypothetical protein
VEEMVGKKSSLKFNSQGRSDCEILLGVEY